MKQLKDAKAAGYNVTPGKNIFSKYYLAWTTFLPPVDNSNDPTPHRLMTAGLGINHPVYDIGGDIGRPTLGLLNYGAIDENALKQAKTDEERNNAAASINTEANLNRLYQNDFAIKYMAMLYLKNKLNNGKGLSQSERDRLMDEYVSSLTPEQVNSVVINNAAKDAVLETVQPKGILHDTYIIKDIDGSCGLTAEQVADTKEMIQTEGTVMVVHAAPETKDDTNVYLNSGEVKPFYTSPNHAESLVGWDDNYVFHRYANEDGSPIQGAFIMRNSWGATMAEALHDPSASSDPMAKDGYGYLAYQDTSTTGIAFFNAGLDAKRYTINQNNAPGADGVDCIVTSMGTGTQAIANSYTAGTDSGQFLKAVMFYASEKNMRYDITIREGETPGEGTILTQQSGTFGEDGTPRWGGYRTVDLNNFVFLAKDKKYTVEVRTTSPEGNDVYIAQMAGQDVKMDGESYYYDEVLKGWYKTDKFMTIDENRKVKSVMADGDIDPDRLPKGLGDILDPSLFKQIYVFAVARNKESSSANGADFKVSWLDDTNSSGNSVINLGSASELYGTDYTNPDRKTLSNMTVDLGADVYNFYRGSIIGEGSVTKTGAGFLALNGVNTYTGGTLVNNGQLEINGSIAGDATVKDSGVLSGSGTIGGTLYNNHRAVAGNILGAGNLTMENLESHGELVAQNENTRFIVNGAANVDGSTVKIQNALPGETEVLTAASITGNVNTSVAEVSGMLSSTAKVDGNKIVSHVEVTNNLGELNPEQAQTFNAVKNMSAKTTDNNMRRLLNFNADTAKTSLSEIGNSDAAQMMSLAQTSTIANRVISDRLTTAFSLQETNIDVPIPVNNFAVGEEENALTVPVKAELPAPADNDFWIKFTKNWGELKGGANYHSQAISGGYDKAVGSNWRAGLFVSYNATGLGATNSNGNIYDTRFGVYALYHKNTDDAVIYLDGGKIRNKLQRSIPTLGLATNAKYDSTIFEIGGEYKHNLQPERMWQVSPFVNLQYSSMKQGSYTETGAGIFSQQVDSKRNNYFAGQLGVEFKRQFERGSYAARVGVKHAFAGANPELNFRYEGDAGNYYTLKNNQDKTHLVLSIGGENEFAHGWILGGDIQMQKGNHDRDALASVMLRKVW